MPKDDAFSASDPLQEDLSDAPDDAQAMRSKIKTRMEGRSRTNLSTTANAYLKELLRALNFEDGREMNDFIEEGLLYALSKHVAERGELPEIPGPLQVED